MIKRIIFTITIALSLLPITCHARTIYNSAAEIEFEIDDTEWTEERITTENNY